MNIKAKKPDWIAVDWGTSNLRVWAMVGVTPIATAQSENGMAAVASNMFEPALLQLIEPWLTQEKMPVFACGMVGSRQGWAEAPYAAVPSRPIAESFGHPETLDARLSVHIVPGLKQLSPPDVMRGEETQIAGYLSKYPEFDGILCLPGTHTKWVQISAGEVVSFRTFMSGEMFRLLSEKSVIRHSVVGNWDDQAFEEGVSDALAKPEALAARLFTIRADDLLNSTSPDTARARLSGLLIGAELAAARPYWLGQNIVLIGERSLSENYARALSVVGVSAPIADATAATLDGLSAARALIKEPA